MEYKVKEWYDDLDDWLQSNKKHWKSWDDFLHCIRNTPDIYMDQIAHIILTRGGVQDMAQGFKYACWQNGDMSAFILTKNEDNEVIMVGNLPSGFKLSYCEDDLK